MMTTLNTIEITKIDPVLIIITMIATLIGVYSMILYMKNERHFSLFYFPFFLLKTSAISKNALNPGGHASSNASKGEFAQKYQKDDQ